ncbi:hypothetical protein [Frankia sp. AvcI1]|uniref:hypothetical protein n=1 Tax=Frankia sp. AvcI1 TaxID=573496 RepID=UPI0021188AF7|nr:hypothetical protein [Frankia sp. AvcI1]
MADWLWISHPETGGVQLVTGEALTEAWAPRGWLPVEIDYAAASAVRSVPITEPRQLDAEYVAGLVAARAAAQAETPAESPEPEIEARPSRATKRSA